MRRQSKRPGASNKQRGQSAVVKRRARETGREIAEKEAVRIPWPKLLKARQQYVQWQAYLLWVRAIEDAEGHFPEWLAEIVDRRARGFLRFAAEYEFDHARAKTRPCFWWFLQEWIGERIFANAWREGWMNAVGFYAVRDLACIRDHAFAEYCEREWKKAKPAVYPAFHQWRKASEQSSDEILESSEMPGEKRELIKLSRRVSPKLLRNEVNRYLDWEVLAYWARTALESTRPLPASVEAELRKKCSGFLEADNAAQASHPDEESHRRWQRLMSWIEDREFLRARTDGWIEVLRYHVRLHPRHDRIRDYWLDWESVWPEHSSARYPSLRQWSLNIDRYAFELEA